MVVENLMKIFEINIERLKALKTERNEQRKWAGKIVKAVASANTEDEWW